MKTKTPGHQTRIFYYILPPLVILFILLAFFHNSSGQRNSSNPPSSNTGDSESRREPGNRDSSSGSNPDNNIPKPTQNRANSSRNTSSSSSRSTPPEATPASPYTVANKRAITPQDNFIAPRFSPDGLDVICTKYKYRGLYLVSRDGSEIRQLSDEFGIGYNVRWSDDGTKLIIKTGDKTKVIDLTGEEIELSEEELKLLEESKVYAKNDNIYLKDPQSGEEVSITSGEDTFFEPIMSPDGNKVAYQGLTTGIHIKDLETGEVIDLGQGASCQWLPDGSGLIYNFMQDDGMNVIAADIYFAYPDGSGTFNITNTPDIIEMNPSISPDGTYLTYEVDGQVFIADLMRGP
jgi:Tol biopolymer transport system component